MGRRKKNEEKDEKEGWLEGEVGHFFELHADAKKSIAAILLFGIGILLLLSSAGKAGPAGNSIYGGLSYLFGWGYFIMPALLIISGFVFLMADRQRVVGVTLFGSLFLFISSLGIIDILSPSSGGLLGQGIGTIKIPFGNTASLVLTISIFLASLVATLNMPIRLKNPFARSVATKDEALTAEEEEHVAEASEETSDEEEESVDDDEKDGEDEVEDSEKEQSGRSIFGFKKKAAQLARYEGAYVFPPLSLLKSSVEKPTSGDLRANANIIKRTLESFGVPVEMGEISVGPKVTRYTLKPAEGVKISRINALNQDLALALAAHPIRIEAPIPGKSLVGIEVPNKSAAIVRLGSMLNYKEFMDNGLLSFVLGRDVTGDPIMADLTKMPHLLIAGATGSGKSVAIHSLILSLLYKNSPETLRLVMIDPKRVELTVYNGLPHLVSPVVTDAKKTTNVFRWAISEMEERYKKLEAAGNRDIKSYNTDHKKEPLPYVVIVIDELADLMSSHGKVIEGSIVRIAQMARATGIHLVVATQRPSVEVITGLIKANITSRMALQVASQIDSRTILDTSGAEKLLGGGDMLFISSDFSKPKRIQGAFVSEEEIRAVADFVRDKNEDLMPETDVIADSTSPTREDADSKDVFDDYGGDEVEDDELYDEALETVRVAKKASASLLQRRLKVGYARAARLLDIMEANGAIGPGDGAKPREVFIETED